MMLTKPKPSDISGQKEVTPVEEPELVTTDDRRKQLELRLAMLGDATEEPETQEAEIQADEAGDDAGNEEVAPTDDTVDGVAKEENLLSFDPPAVTAPVAPAPAPIVEEKQKPAAVKPAASKPNKSALLARIMAAQERAKQAEMKQASTQRVEEKPKCVVSEKEKMLKALNGETVEEPKEEKAKLPVMSPPPIMAPPVMAPPSMAAPPPIMAPPVMAPPVMAAPPTFMAPPPPFEMVQQQKPAAVQAPPPPTFDSISEDIFMQPGVPSAPPVEEHVAPNLLDHLDGVQPMAPPPPVYPANGTLPTFEDAMQQQQTSDPGLAESDVYDFDIDGNELTPEDRRKMMEEQRAIMEQITNEANQNKASVAAVKANAFESRMNAPGNHVPTERPTDDVNTAAIDIEEQRRILEQIQKEAKTMQNTSETQSSEASESGRIVDIGAGQKVSLHGQEKTQEAIKDGTAILVQCANCENWMQVTEKASLMFCPICSVVSPVIQQDQVLTTEDALQLEEDRKLAERLQEEENNAVSDYPANRRSRAAASGASTTASAESGGWWDSLMVNMGVSGNPEETDNQRSAEINVSRPPTSGMHSVTTGSEDYSEREGLIGGGGGGGEGGGRMARVAESKPLFSCVVDSISNTATAIGTGVASYVDGDEDEEVHGIDTTSFLTVPNVGRDRDNASGSYHAIPGDN